MKYIAKINMKKNTAKLLSASIIMSTSLTNLSIASAEDYIQAMDNTSGSAIVMQEIQPLSTVAYVDSDFTFDNFKVNNVIIGKRIKGFTSAGEAKLIANNYELIFPDTIAGMQVVCIGNHTFKSKGIKKLTLPSNLIKIEYWAFPGNEIETLDIPASVTTIEQVAFQENKLKNLIIPDGVTTLDMNAFAMNELTYVELPNNLTVLDSAVFANNHLTSIEIPDSVTRIASSAFMNNQLTSIEISDNVTSIDSNAFANNQLKSVVIPNSVKYLGPGAFAKNDLKYIKFEDASKGLDVMRPLWNGPNQTTVNQKHGIPLWSTSLPHTDENVFAFEDYSVTYTSGSHTAPQLYAKYPVNIIYELKENSTVEVASGFPTDAITDVGVTGWTDLSFVTPEDLKDKFSKLIVTNEDGYDVLGWKIVNEDEIEILELDGQEYVMSDVKVEPIYDKIGLEVTQSGQLDLLTSKFESSIYFKDTIKGTIIPNEVFNFSLTDGYMFNFDGDLKVTFENSNNETILVKSDDVFKEGIDAWQYMLGENGKTISIKAPNVIKKIDEKAPIVVKMDNIGIKDSDGIFGDTKPKVVEIFLNKDKAKTLSGVIATLEFQKSIVAEVVKPKNVTARRTDSSGSITVKSNVRYSIHDNELFEIKLDSGFRFINDTPDVDDPEKQGEYINITNTGNEVAMVYVPNLADFDNNSTKWQYTYSDDFSTIYVSTPIGLHGELDENGVVKNVPNVDLAKGISFSVSHIGVSALETNQFTGAMPVNYTVTDGEGFIQSGLFAILNTETIPPTGGGGGSSGGGSGGGHRPKKDKPTVVEPEKPEEAEILIDPYIFGYADGSIRPDGSMTRAEVAQVIYNIYGKNKTLDKSILNNFSDVNSNAWYSNAVAYSTKTGVFEGYTDGTFKPNSRVSREELAAIIDRLYFDEIVSYGELDIKLSDIQNSWAKEDIEYLVSKGIIAGYPDGTFKPKQSIERDEFVVMMNKLTNRPNEYKATTTFYDLSSSAWNYEDMMSASNYAIKKDVK